MSVDLDAPVHLPLELFLRAQLVRRDPVAVRGKKKRNKKKTIIRPQDDRLNTVLGFSSMKYKRRFARLVWKQPADPLCCVIGERLAWMSAYHNLLP